MNRRDTLALTLAGLGLPVRARSTTSAMQTAVQIIQTQIDNGTLHNAVLHVRRGDKVTQHVFGKATTDSMFLLGSITKPLAVALPVMILVDRGELKLSDRAVKYLPEFNEGARKDITIEQLLTLARLDTSGKITTDTFLPLPTLLHEALARQQDAIARKNLRIDLAVETDQEALVPQYYSNLIVNNIVDNAIKYSGEGTAIHIVIATTNGHLVCTIQDQGIGVKPADLEHLFDNFFRSDALEHRQISGNGLGLSIAQSIISQHQGLIECDSEPGRTCFSLLLPMEPVDTTESKGS